MLLLVGCAHNPPPAPLGSGPAVDVVLVPGCPSRADGTLSGCQWQRVIWAVDLYQDGVATEFITSGNAVHSPFIEAEAIKAGMVALGVPAEHIHTETQALHTDQNAAYTLLMMEDLGFETIGIASHGGHARGARSFMREWGTGALAMEMDLDRVNARFQQGLPQVRTEPVEPWMSMREREKLIAKRTGKAKRPSSVWVYAWVGITGRFAKLKPPVPPTREPTLRGLRYRDDHKPWSDGQSSTSVTP